MMKSQKPLLIRVAIFKATLENFTTVSSAVNLVKFLIDSKKIIRFQIMNSAGAYMACLKSFIE